MKHVSITFVVFLSLVGLLLAGCSTVRSQHKVGRYEGKLAEDDHLAKQFEGLWSDGSENRGYMFIKHIKEGHFRVAGVQWDGGHLKVNEMDAFLTVEQDVYYINLLDTEADGDKPEYTFVRLAIAMGDDKEKNRTMVFYLPQSKTFEKAIQEKQLLGKIKREQYATDILIQSDKQALDAFIDPLKVAEQFNLNEPLVLMPVR